MYLYTSGGIRMEHSFSNQYFLSGPDSQRFDYRNTQKWILRLNFQWKYFLSSGKCHKTMLKNAKIIIFNRAWVHLNVKRCVHGCVLPWYSGITVYTCFCKALSRCPSYRLGYMADKKKMSPPFPLISIPAFTFYHPTQLSVLCVILMRRFRHLTGTHLHHHHFEIDCNFKDKLHFKLLVLFCFV